MRLQGRKKERISQINDVVNESLYELNNDDKNTRMTANSQKYKEKEREREKKTETWSKSGSSATKLGVFN